MKSIRLVLRFGVIGALVLALLVPLTLIRSVVHERERYRAEAVQRVADSKAGPQRLLGPVRVLPWTEVRQVREVDADGVPRLATRTVRGRQLQMPAQLEVGGVLRPSERRIGLFRVQVYSWDAEVEASFAPLTYAAVPGRTYEAPYLAFGLQDVRGLVGTPEVSLDGRALRLQAGLRALEERSRGVSADLAPLADDGQGTLPALARVRFAGTIDGTRSLEIVPLGDANRIELSSAWPHPLFGGRFLPNAREIGAEGFRADWSLSALATAAQTQFESGETPDAVKVSLVEPVDVYTQVDRATKYGLLFVLLTFLAFGLFELIRRWPIHPLQYLLVGLALAMFFLVLLGLSEHLPFAAAYAVAALACIGLQWIYLAGVLRSRLRAGGFAGLLTALYGTLYGLLVSEDAALLLGALLLFGVLAAVMWITRGVDWYAMGADQADPAGRERDATV